jgi:hypothetical protein
MKVPTKKIIYVFLTISVGVLLIHIVANWQMARLKKSLSQPLFKELEKMPLEEIQKKFFGETSEYKEFVSPDGKLKLKYLADWIEMDKGILETFNQEIIKKEVKILFFAQKFKVKTSSFAYLIIQELEKEKWKGLDEIIEEMKKESKERGVEIEIVKINKESGIFEAKYKKANQPEIHSSEKIVEGKEKIYLIAFLTFEKSWEEFQPEMNSIFNSVEIIK